MKQTIVVFGIIAILNFVQSKPPGITRDTGIELPGTERIFKRSIGKSNEEDLDAEENGLVFRPIFRSNRRFRNRRSVKSEQDDMEVAENGLIFRPLFRSNRRFRTRRAAEDDMEVAENGLVFRPLFRRRNRRSVQPAEEMETADNGLVFRPIFRSNRRFRNRRSVQPAEEMETADNGLVFRPIFRSNRRFRNRRSADEDMEVAENGGVFRPLFKAHHRIYRKYRYNPYDDYNPEENQIEYRFKRDSNMEQTESHRLRRAIDDDQEDANEINDKDDLETAENVVFRPVFKARSQYIRRRYGRSIENVYSANTSPGKLLSFSDHEIISGVLVPELVEFLGNNGKDMDDSESGLVFRPLFKVRYLNARRNSRNRLG